MLLRCLLVNGDALIFYQCFLSSRISINHRINRERDLRTVIVLFLVPGADITGLLRSLSHWDSDGFDACSKLLILRHHLLDAVPREELLRRARVLLLLPMI